MGAVMTFEQFDKFTEELLVEVRQMRDTKGKEYCHTTDRFENFNRLSRRMEMERLKVWLVYFTKHMDAIESYIKHGREFSTESIRSRFVDAITYLTLAAGMVQEDKGLKGSYKLYTQAELEDMDADVMGKPSFSFCSKCGAKNLDDTL